MECALEATKAIYCFANLILRNASFADDQNLFVKVPFIVVVDKNFPEKIFMFSTLYFSGDYKANTKANKVVFVSKTINRLGRFQALSSEGRL